MNCFLTFTNLPFNIRMKSIKFLSSVPSSKLKSIDAMNEYLFEYVKELIDLENETIFDMSGKKTNFRVFLAFIASDHLGAHQLLSFKCNFQSCIRICRFCEKNRSDICSTTESEKRT